MSDEKHPNRHTSSDYLNRQAWATAHAVNDIVFSRIEHILDERGITLKQISRDLDIPYRTIQNWAMARSTCPTDVVRRLCAYLGVEADYILFGGVDLDIPSLLQVLNDMPASLVEAFVHQSGAGGVGETGAEARAGAIRALADHIRVGYLRIRDQRRIREPDTYSAPEGRYVAGRDRL